MEPDTRVEYLKPSERGRALCHAWRASSFFLPSCKYANATVAAAAVYLPSHSISAALLLLLFWALLLFFCSVCGCILGGLGGLLGLGGRTSLISGPFPHISLSLSGSRGVNCHSRFPAPSPSSNDINITQAVLGSERSKGSWGATRLGGCLDK